MQNYQVLSMPPLRNGKAQRAVDLVYRYQPGVASPALPATSGEANLRLRDGNKNLSRFIPRVRPGAATRGASRPPSCSTRTKSARGPTQPATLSRNRSPWCLGADARTPAEITFCQSFNDIFNIRVAGNVLGVECAGSVRYALDHFAPCSQPVGGNTQSLKLMLALGHRNCGAVQVAVDAYQSDLPPDLLPDSSIEAILRRISSPPL